jgi:hypothetical protein
MHMHVEPERNRRRSKRSLITIAVKKIHGDRLTLCQSSNISPDGIFVAGAGTVGDGPGVRCWLEFTLPGSEIEIRARGKVVWETTYDNRYHLSAIVFTAIAPSHRRLIEKYVDGPPVATSTPVFLPPPSYP